MKKISIVIPTYNEELNVLPLVEVLTETFKNDLSQYDYEIIFIDNKSKDSTRDKLRIACAKDKRVKALLNAKNFGQFNSPYYALMQSTGDCTILLSADFQDPIDVIPKLVSEWEKGFRIVIGIKTTSKENKLMYFLRTCYYKGIRKMSDVEQIEHFTGFGLYDQSFIEVLRSLDDPSPYFRGIVAELGFERSEVEYAQAKRRAGKTSNNWYRLYDAGMLGITSYTKALLRVATIVGFIFSAISFLVSIFYFVLKLIYWNQFAFGTAPIIIGIYLLGSIQIFFIGIVGEYILNINTRIMNRPLVVVEQKLNFDEDEHQ